VLRELFVIPGLNIPIYAFGFMLVLAIFAAIRVARFLSPRFGINPEFFVTAAFIALFTGIAGARISHVIENYAIYTDSSRSAFANLKAAVNIQQGGLTYYGGFLLGMPCTVLYGVWKKMPVLRSMDIVAPCLMIGLGIGRIGCFLNGCCWGGVCPPGFPHALSVQFPYDSPAYLQHVEQRKITPPYELLIDDPGQPLTVISRDGVEGNARLALLARGQKSLPVHPVQIYSLLTALLIAGFCVAQITLRPTPGMVFASMMILEGIGRFTLELLRIEPSVTPASWPAMSVSMVLGILLSVAGVVFAAVLKIRTK